MMPDHMTAFRTDSRAVAPVIGFILMFGILVIAFSTYQAYSVPQQNSEVEFQHSQDVRNDLVQVRQGLLQAASSGSNQFQSVKLGTSYPTRAFAINPPSPGGSLRTSEPGYIRLQNTDTNQWITNQYWNGESDIIPTRSLVYQAYYNELPQQTYRLEQALLYLNAQSSVVPITDQRLARDADPAIQLLSLQNAFSTTGIDSRAVDLIADNRTTGSLETGDYTLTVPTQLSQSQWATVLERTFPDSTPPINVNENLTVSDWRVVEEDNTISLDLAVNGTVPIGTSQVGLETRPDDESPPFFAVEITGTNTPVADGDTLEVTARITNIGGQSDSQTVSLSTDGTVRDTATTEALDPGESTTRTLQWNTTTNDIGSYDAIVRSADDSDSTPVQVQDTLPITLRVDDLTFTRSNDPFFYVSYDANISFDNIEITAQSTESSASDQTTTTQSRGGVRLEPGFGADQEFDITVRVLRDGNTVAERTLTTDADTVNPIDNDNLSQPTSATLENLNIRDRSNPNQNDVEYGFDYTVSPTGSFSEVELLALNRNSNGGSATVVTTDQSSNNFRVDPGDGTNSPYKVGILVRDGAGAVVDELTVEDIADGDNPVVGN